MDKFLKGYIIAALWSSTDDAGEPLDRGRDEDDVAPETVAKMQADCEAFKTQNEALLNEAYAHMTGGNDPDFDPQFRAGFCFWLNRNGHGTGFWDERGIDKNGIGEKLSEASHKFGQCDLYVGDDGKIYA